MIGLGANLGDREATIDAAIALLDADPHLRVEAVSSLRETEPVGYLDQEPFLNAVVAVETDLGAPAVLERLLALERALGRVRDGPRFGPRAIDLDLLVFGPREIDEPGLQVPHPRLHERRFVLEPLHELDPGLSIPGRGPVADLLRAAADAPGVVVRAARRSRAAG
jgi:2-amino-4-hydroxy-6-hydroxymethyldihydropteridine diphosphokinase